MCLFNVVCVSVILFNFGCLYVLDSKIIKVVLV